MSPEQERQLLLAPHPDGDSEHTLHRIAVGVGLLERRLAATPQAQATDDDLMMASLALSLERLARDAELTAADDGQRRRLADAARRIRVVIDELAVREQTRLSAVAGHEPPAAEPVSEPLPEQVAAPPAAASAAHDSARPWRRIAGAALIAFGLALALFLAFEFFYTGQLESRSQHSLRQTFQTRIAAGAFDAPSAPVEPGPVAVLQIPQLGADQVVVQGSSPEDLQQGPGHLPGTPLPGEFGNSVIVGHRLTYGGPFQRLDQLAVGDTFDVLTGQGRFDYKVSKVSTVSPGEADVIGRSADSRITLVTSASPMSSDRRAVTATLQGNPVAVPTRPQATASGDELGTTGDVSGLYLAIIWLIALAGMAYAAVRAYRAWPRMAAYLVTTPPLLLLLYLAFTSFDRFLPGTL